MNGALQVGLEAFSSPFKGGKRMKRRRKPHWVLLALLLALLYLPLRAPSAVECSAGTQQVRRLVPVGRAVGIKLFSHGVMVVGLENVDTGQGSRSPARESGLKVGDIITELDGESVNTIEDVSAIVERNGPEPLSITALRKGQPLATTALPCLSGDAYRLGAWIRDSMAGIGTVTWYDPASGTFCALGHGINDVDTTVLMPLKNGGIMAASVTAVQKGSPGAPGQLHGSFDLSRDLGTLTGNTESGVFGQLCEGEFPGEAMEVARREQVHTGAATILCNVDGNEVREYSVELLRIYPSAASETRNLMVQVTDEVLLERTGGIVQGMSGSPILQDGHLVGAVTHVWVRPCSPLHWKTPRSECCGELPLKRRFPAGQSPPRAPSCPRCRFRPRPGPPCPAFHSPAESGRGCTWRRTFCP